MTNSYIMIYESELSCVVHETSSHTTIETGGSLFGLWTDKGNPTIMLATRPGPKAIRRSTQFEQDADAHQRLEHTLFNMFGVQSVGLWHSHHRLGLHELSGGDLHRTMRFADRTARTKFCDILCYFESRRDNEVTVKPYVYTDAADGKRVPTEFRVLPGVSPVRTAMRANSTQWLAAPTQTGVVQWRLARSVELGARHDEDAAVEIKRGRLPWRKPKRAETEQPQQTTTERDQPAELSFTIDDLPSYISRYVEPALRGVPTGVTCELEPIEDGQALRLTIHAASLGEEHALDLGWNGVAAVVLRHVRRRASEHGPKELLAEDQTPILAHELERVRLSFAESLPRR